MLKQVRETAVQPLGYDFVIGGGATGAGVAVRCGNAGLLCGSCSNNTTLAKGLTSSRSTKLVHGGVRYLEQGNVSLVMEALKEPRDFCGKMRRILVSELACIVSQLRLVGRSSSTESASNFMSC